MNLSVPIISVIVGVAILFFGRKLFWLFVAALGFAVGLEIAAYFMKEPPQWMTLVVALGCGVIGALLAILLQKIAIAIAGFIGGGEKAVGERKKSVAGDGAAFEGKTGFVRFPHRDARRIDARHLPGADPERAIGRGINDRVRLHVLHHAPSKNHRRHFRIGRF